jgi:hypothetical protein
MFRARVVPERVFLETLEKISFRIQINRIGSSVIEKRSTF